MRKTQCQFFIAATFLIIAAAAHNILYIPSRTALYYIQMAVKGQL